MENKLPYMTRKDIEEFVAAAIYSSTTTEEAVKRISDRWVVDGAQMAVKVAETILQAPYGTL